MPRFSRRLIQLNSSAKYNSYKCVNPLIEYPEHQFVNRFRMKKSSFNRLFDLIKDDFAPRMKNRKHSPELLLLAVLRYFATGHFQVTDGDLYGLSKSYVSKLVKLISSIIASKSRSFIRFPTESEFDAVKDKFKKIACFPNVIGCIDGCQIRNKVPLEIQQRFINRKHYSSWNIQVIMDADMMVRDLDARWPGSTHDSRVFQCSGIGFKLANNEINGFILGDSGYPLTSYLSTPFKSETLNAAELQYQKRHCKTRNLIERGFGCIKKRFNCLNHLTVSPSTQLNVIVSCIVIWNFLLLEKDIESFVDYVNPSIETISSNISSSQLNESERAKGVRVRNNLVNTYFESLRD